MDSQTPVSQALIQKMRTGPRICANNSKEPSGLGSGRTLGVLAPAHGEHLICENNLQDVVPFQQNFMRFIHHTCENEPTMLLKLE